VTEIVCASFVFAFTLRPVILVTEASSVLLVLVKTAPPFIVNCAFNPRVVETPTDVELAPIASRKPPATSLMPTPTSPVVLLVMTIRSFVLS